MEGVSIIVCCYNSIGRIEKTLSHLACLELVTKTEVIVVDNNSNDGTGAVVEEKWRKLKSPFKLRLVKESKPGLSYARKKGVVSAKYDVILFCDDDNFLSTDYLTLGYKFMTANPDVGALFGYSRPVFESTPPQWIYDFLEAYAVGPNGLDSGEVQPPVVPWGAGLWMPKKFLDQVWPDKRESKLADRTGNTLSSGGDTELCYWAKDLGYKWYFLKEMTFDHLVPTRRVNKKYLRELFYCFGRAEAKIGYYYSQPKNDLYRIIPWVSRVKLVFSKIPFVKLDLKLELKLLKNKGFNSELKKLRNESSI